MPEGSKTLCVDHLHPLHILPQTRSVEQESCIIKYMHQTICFKLVLIHLTLNEKRHEKHFLDTAFRASSSTWFVRTYMRNSSSDKFMASTRITLGRSSNIFMHSLLQYKYYKINFMYVTENTMHATSLLHNVASLHSNCVQDTRGLRCAGFIIQHFLLVTTSVVIIIISVSSLTVLHHRRHHQMPS